MRWEHDGTESRYSWPYRIRENIVKVEASGQLDRGEYSLATSSMLNWQSGTGGALIDNGARWNIHVQDGEWDCARLDLSLSIDDVNGFRQDVLPTGEDPEILFSVLCRCAATRWRSLATQTFGNGESAIQLTIERGMVRGEVAIIPFIILAERIDKNVLEKASNKASILATGFPIYIWADEPEDVIPRGGLDMQWEDFPDNCKDALYKLVLNDYSIPVLYMNNRHPTLTSILDSTSRQKNDETRIRDAVFAFMASDIGIQLARYAVKYQLESEGESDLPEMILNSLSRQIKQNRDWISSRLTDTDDEEEDSFFELHLAIQHSRKLNRLMGDLVSGIQVDIPGGE